MEELKISPSMLLSIYKYFTKQEKCRKLVADADNPIKEVDIVLLLVRHLGKVAGLGKKTVIFKKKSKAERKWKLSKKI